MTWKIMKKCEKKSSISVHRILFWFVREYIESAVRKSFEKWVNHSDKKTCERKREVEEQSKSYFICIDLYYKLSWYNL